MRFQIVHQTEYIYDEPASESFAELRVWPQDSESQTVLKRSIELNPAVPVDTYTDYYGNLVEFFSIPFRHNRLQVKAQAEIVTYAQMMPKASLEVTVAECRQIFNSQMLDLYEFLHPSYHVPMHRVLSPLRRNFIRNEDTLGDALLGLNKWIHSNFKYVPGATEIETPLIDVIRKRQGVCQDFAHLMLSILRTYGLPARYVSGYIEASDPTGKASALVGAMASHAWIEVCLPGGAWWGLDPTNNQVVGERHVKVAVGRDYRDITPLRGTYKGASNQKLDVMVSMKRRRNLKTGPAPAPSNGETAASAATA